MKAIGIIFTGGDHTAMEGLTERRSIAALPMLGQYRAIDFVMTNMSKANIDKIAVLAQYNTKSLNEHLSSQKWWNIGSKRGGLYMFHPTITPENANWYRGSLDAIYQNLHYLRGSHEPYVVIASANGIYQMDYQKVLEQHMAKHSDITMVTAKVRPWESSKGFYQVETDEKGRVIRYEKNVDNEFSQTVDIGAYVIRRRVLIDLLEKAKEEERVDFVRDIIEKYYKTKKIHTYTLDSYYSRISSAKSYFNTNMDFLKKEVQNDFFGEGNRILTKISDLPPAKFNRGSSVKNSMISSGTIINGVVENSIISKKAYIGNNCIIRNSIILYDTYIGDGSVIENCIVESYNTIKENTRYTGPMNNVQVIREDNNRFII